LLNTFIPAVCKSLSEWFCAAVLGLRKITFLLSRSSVKM